MSMPYWVPGTRIMEQMLDLRNSKCYKIGEKNLVTRDNDFEMATGNVNGIMGYDSRIRIKGTNKVDSTKSPPYYVIK